MTWTARMLLLAATLCLATGVFAQQQPAAPAQAPAQRQIVLTIMSPQANTFAPGIDATVALTQEQANQVAAVYREVYQSAAVILANLVLQDNGSTMDQRRAADATLQQAHGLFQARARSIFTEPQQKLIDSVQAAFTKVLEAQQADFNARVKANFAAELEKILTPEQKAAMAKARAAIEEQQKKAQEQQAPAGGGTPATPPAQ